MKFRSIAAVIATCATIAFAAAASAPNPASSEMELQDLEALARSAAASEDSVGAFSTRTQFSPVFSAADAKPAEESLSHEARASDLWTGRRFLAHGRAIDARARDTRVERASSGSPPAGWSRLGDKLAHRESGLECPASFTLRGKDKDRILALHTVTAYDSRNRDVSCNYVIDGDAAVTIYASYYPDMTLEDHAAGAVAAIRQNFDVRGELPVTLIEVDSRTKTVSTDPLPAALSGAFDVGEINGVPYKTAIWLAKTHGWHVKARATYAQSDFASEIVAAVLFGVNYVNIDMKNRKEPTGAGPEV